MATTKTTTSKNYVAYTTSVVDGKNVKEYISDDNGSVLIITCKPSHRLFELSKVYKVQDDVEYKFQTEEAFDNMIDRKRKTEERKETRANSKEGKQALDLVNKIHSAIHTAKDETRKKRNRTVFSLVDGLNIQGETRREKFLAVIASYEALGIEIHDDIVNFINSL